MRFARLVASLGLMAICAFAGLPPGLAAGAVCSDRAYAAARDFTAPANLGVRDFVFVHAATTYDYAAGGHVNETIWEGTGGSNDLASWVEIGWTKGWKGSNILTFYWADDRPSHPYADHKINTPTATEGNWYHFKIHYTGNDTWTVYIDGSQPNNGGGVSVDNPANSRSMQAGLESTSQCSDMGSSSNPSHDDNLSYYTTGGGWSGAWDSGTTKYIISPAGGSWVTVDQDWQDWL